MGNNVGINGFRPLLFTLITIVATSVCAQSQFVSGLERQGNKIFDNLKFSISKSRVENTPENFTLLDNYRKFYLESENLDYFCRENKAPVNFKNAFERDEFIRSMIATLQYKMMNYSISAIATYAKKLQFDSEQYDNLVDGLIGSCSQNTTLYSHRLLKYLFKQDFDSQEAISVPQDISKKLFTEKVSEVQSENEVLVNELYYTTGVFSYACSWGGQVQFLRKMAPFLRSPVIMSYIIREMTGLETHTFNDKLKDQKVALCKNQICRPKTLSNFTQEIAKPIGSSNMAYDLSTIYCRNFQTATQSYSPNIDKNFKDHLKQFDKQEERLIGQFIALLTRIPDFNVWTQSSEMIKRYISISNDGLWNFWAKDLLARRVDYVMYEDALEMQVDRLASDRFIRAEGRPQINFNVVNGEFDRATNDENMITLNFDIKFPAKDLDWIFEQYKIAVNANDEDSIELLKTRLNAYIAKDYEKVKDLLATYSVNSDLLTVMMKEVLRQFDTLEELILPKSRQVSIRVNIRIAPFALVAIRNKRVISELSERDAKEIKSLEVLNNIDSMAEKSKK